MTITIGENIAGTIDEIDRNQFELGFRHLCTAIDQSAKKHYKTDRSGRKNYQKFIKEYYWVLELIVFPGLDLENSKFGNFPIQTEKDLLSEPSFADIIYHVIRCGLTHDDGIPKNIKFTETNLMYLDKEILHIPKNLIWGIIAIIVFAECNHDEQIAKRFWIEITGNRLCINDFFGEEAVLNSIYNKNIPRSQDEKKEPLKVAIVLSAGHSTPLLATFG